MSRLATLPARIWQRKSALILIIANLIPIWGVLFDAWSAFSVVFLFWIENVIIGIFNVVKLLLHGAFVQMPAPDGQPEPTPVVGRILAVAGMTFMAAFFTFHYGLFCLVHGGFVMSLLGGGDRGFPNPFARALHEAKGDLGFAILALVISHGYSLVMNYFRGGEYKRVNSTQLMGGPYGRIVILHLAILFGAFLTVVFGSGIGVLLLLVIGKIFIDVQLHLKERERGVLTLRSPRPQPPPRS